MITKSHKRQRSIPSSQSSEPWCKKTKQGFSVSDGYLRTHSQQRGVLSPPSFHQSEPSCKKRERTGNEQVFNGFQKLDHKFAEESVGLEPKQECSLSTEGVQEQDPISYWARTGWWPKSFGKMSELESQNPNKRLRSSTPSYSSRRRDGSVPLAHTAAYEEVLRRCGIMFNDDETNDLVTVQSKEMCQALLEVNQLPPIYNSCREETFMRKFRRATKCNEERVRRDLTPHIVPSAELLYAVDGIAELEHVREEMSGNWTKCPLLGGTQPRPDYAYGLSSASFSEEELAKLENYTNLNNPTKFTECMYFPFLLCEVKCGQKNINDAERQNVHSASIAVHAIVQLCHASGEDVGQTLHGNILVFSISHDNERVKIYGHFPLIREGRVTFHRYYIHDYTLDGHYGRNVNTGSNFTRALYRDFYPLHLNRIRQAVERFPAPQTQTTSIVFDLDETQTSEHLSQETGSSTRPPRRLPKSQGSQGDLTLMKQQMAKMDQMHKAEMEQLKEENQKQMEQLKEESQKEMEQLKEESQKEMEQLKEESQKQAAVLQRLLDSKQD